MSCCNTTSVPSEGVPCSVAVVEGVPCSVAMAELLGRVRGMLGPTQRWHLARVRGTSCLSYNRYGCTWIPAATHSYTDVAQVLCSKQYVTLEISVEADRIAKQTL